VVLLFDKCETVTEGARPTEEGFVLIPVLAALFLLALSAVVLSRSVALDLRITKLANQRAMAAEMSEGMTRLAIRHLIAAPPLSGKSGELRVDGVPRICAMGQRLVTVSFIDTDGMINLNRATPALLQRVIAGAGLSEAEAQQLAETIVDFRSTGESSMSGASKLVPYQRAGLNHGPKTGPFEAVGELDQVAGMTPALFGKLRPLLTIHSRFGTINPRVAGLPVLQALAGSGTSLTELVTAESIDDLRTKVVIPSDFTYIPMTRSVRQTTSNTYVVSVVVEQPDGIRAGRQAIVELNPAKQEAIVKAWADLDARTITVRKRGGDAPPACIGGLLKVDLALP
jgi:general secretion pathway protein K